MTQNKVEYMRGYADGFKDGMADCRKAFGETGTALGASLAAALKGVNDDIMTFHDATGRGEEVLSEETHKLLTAAVENAVKADAYHRYTHMRACNAEDDLERLRAPICSCKGTDDLCPCQNR